MVILLYTIIKGGWYIVEEIANELIEMANDDYEFYELVHESLEDVKNNNVMTLEELKKEVATWK